MLIMQPALIPFCPFIFVRYGSLATSVWITPIRIHTHRVRTNLPW